MKPIDHGTNKGFQGHRYRKEVSCDACREARRVYQRASRAKARAAAGKKPHTSAEHGTVSGAAIHYRAKEKPCEPCRVAVNAKAREYVARRKAEGRPVQSSKLDARLSVIRGRLLAEGFTAEQVDEWLQP